jgi:hypothetical protein
LWLILPLRSKLTMLVHHQKNINHKHTQFTHIRTHTHTARSQAKLYIAL